MRSDRTESRSFLAPAGRRRRGASITFPAPRQRGFLLGVALAALAISSLAAGCGDDAAGPCDASTLDATLDGGVGGDALVDNGPLDCGAPPNDAGTARCVQGRLYDFVTRQPITAGVERRVFGFYGSSPGDEFGLPGILSNPDYTPGRLAPNGRFAIWVNQATVGGFDSLVLDGDVPGYLPSTVNGYGGLQLRQLPDLVADHAIRFYLVPDTVVDDHGSIFPTLDLWDASWPGEASLVADRPLLLGQCLNKDWTSLIPSALEDYNRYYDWSFWDGRMWHQEYFSFSSDRLEFPTQERSDPQLRQSLLEGGGSACIIPLEWPGEDPLTLVTGIQLTCAGSGVPTFESSPESRASGTADIIIINDLFGEQ